MRAVIHFFYAMPWAAFSKVVEQVLARSYTGFVSSDTIKEFFAKIKVKAWA
jgi:hypothetical protein